jgi:phosphatidylglycerophosphate synthase
MQKLPILLIYSRLLLGVAIVLLGVFHADSSGYLSVTLLTIGLLTDIFDGIIARHLNVSTQRLRRLDSSVDQVFFIAVAIAAYLQHHLFFKQHATALIVLLAVEALTYVVSFLKFKKEIATHSIGAKIWTLLLFATLIQLLLTGNSTTLFAICFWVGLVTRVEIVAIIITIKQWTNDVPTLYHAIQLRQGKAIKRHKLFNG